MNSTIKKDFKGLDFFKFIMAIFVVAIHTHPFEEINDKMFTQVWDLVVTIAVPYFFIASGFLLFSKINKEQDKNFQLDKVKQYTIRIIKLYIYWTLIYLPITIWYFVTNDNSFFRNTLEFIKGVFILGENFYSWPLWYLLSIIYSLAIIYYLVYKNLSVNKIFIVSICIFIISSLMNLILNSDSSYNLIFILKKIINHTFGSGRLFSGMLYIMIGGLFANNKIRLSKGKWILLFFVGIIFQYFELPFISPILFLLIPTLIFHISINIDMENFKHGYFFRKSSTVMYFTHMIIFFLYTLFFKDFIYYGWDAFLISTLIPIVLTPIIIKKEKKYNFLNKIF